MTTANSMREMSRKVRKLLSSDFHFILVMYPKSGKGMGTYISSAPSEESVMAMRITARKLERKELIPTLESN